jgi:hypothetical protein
MLTHPSRALGAVAEWSRQQPAKLLHAGSNPASASNLTRIVCEAFCPRSSADRAPVSGTGCRAFNSRRGHCCTPHGLVSFGMSV